MGGSKRKQDEEVSFKRKKIKRIKENDSMDRVPHMEEADSESPTAELLSIQAIREGMLILGCVTEVKATSALVSLPGYLTGMIPAMNVSNIFTKHLTAFTEGLNDQDIQPSMEAVLKVGMVIPCKVMEIVKEDRKPSVILSINPQDVNCELKPSSFYPKMVLFVSVCSVEDHGYIVDVGPQSVQGFLPKKHDSEGIKVGSVIPTYVKQIIVRDKLFARIQLSKLDLNQEFPQFGGDEIKLQSLLPGTQIEVDVIEIKPPFVFMKFLLFDACAFGQSHPNIKVGTTIKGTVLFVHPITRMIHVMLGPRPTPQIFQTYFELKRFQVVNNIKFQSIQKNRIYYKIKKGVYGFIKKEDLPDKGPDAVPGARDLTKVSSAELKVKNLEYSAKWRHSRLYRACIVRFHYLDNIVQMSAQKSLLEQKFVLPEDVKVGAKYECIVKNHVEEGMVVRICPALSGFVRRIHMCDAFVTKPESLYPSGSKVKCRVLSTDGCGKVNLTCRESLVNLPDQYVLTSYAHAQRDDIYSGVVVKKTKDYILVLFFNDVKGIISTATIPEGSMFYKGLILMCRVISCNPSESKLKLSLKIGDDPSLRHSTEDEQKASTKKLCTAIKRFCESEAPKPLKAVIKNVKGSQLNIMLNDVKGRVHVTQLGCTTEGVYPLREYSSGQKISVYVTGEYKNKRFLKITSRNTFSKECSLIASSKLPDPGTSFLGFVKQVKDVSAIIWLSPTETGVLHYLHFSTNPKVVRKVKRYLKAGLSIKVSILADEKPTERGKGFALTKIEKSLPEVGKNVLGLVQIGCITRGLILQLPFGYHAVAALTDLTDVYEPIQSAFDKCQKLKFILCHVLEVNHQSKYCRVSLRKSRVYNKEMTCVDSFCPEILSSNLKEGDTVKGFVMSVSSTALNVVFGRNLEGKVLLHHCSFAGCTECIAADKIRAKYPTGSVVTVDVEKMAENFFSLKLADSRNRINVKNERLSIAEDIFWGDVELES